LVIECAQAIFRIGDDFAQYRFDALVVHKPQRCA
jgi:hypothetical protein